MPLGFVLSVPQAVLCQAVREAAGWLAGCWAAGSCPCPGEQRQGLQEVASFGPCTEELEPSSECSEKDMFTSEGGWILRNNCLGCLAML